jgi:hypothetical protein
MEQDLDSQSIAPSAGTAKRFHRSAAGFHRQLYVHARIFSRNANQTSRYARTNDVPMVPEPDRHSDSSEKIGKALASVVSNRVNIA